MNAITISWSQLLYISLGLILFYIAELLLFLRKSGRTGAGVDHKIVAELREQQQHLQQEIEGLKVRIAALQIQQLGEVQAPEAALAAVAANDTPYAHAIRLAQMGKDATAITAECDISRGEADLIVALYRTGTLH